MSLRWPTRLLSLVTLLINNTEQHCLLILDKDLMIFAPIFYVHLISFPQQPANELQMLSRAVAENSSNND